jgi:hypothetical protein
MSILQPTMTRTSQKYDIYKLLSTIEVQLSHILNAIYLTNPEYVN